MPSAEDEERAVFDDDDDDDDDTEGDDSELDDEDDYTDDGAPPPSQPADEAASAAASAGVQYLNSSTPSTFSSDRTPILNPSSSTSVALPQNGAIEALPLSSATPSGADLKIQVTPAADDRRALVPVDDSRRLFQRLWTDDDEMKILQRFLEFTSQRGTTFASHQYDTGPFYEQIKKEIQLEFSKNQLIEKLRRLKKKFRNAASKIASGKEFVFKSPHDQATFEISRKIWSINLKRAHDSDDDDLAHPSNNTDANNTNAGSESVLNSDRRISRSRRRIRRRIEETAVEVPVVGVAVAVEDSTAAIRVTPPSAPIPSIVEETVKSCLEPLFKEILKSAIGMPCVPGLNAGGLALNALLPLNFGGSPVNLPGSGEPVDEKWRKQQIMELEVYLKRIELLQDQIKSTLEELKSSGS